MKKMKKLFLFIMVLTMAIASVSIGAYADDLNYNQWDSQSSYPQDVVGTPLFTPVKFLIDKKVMTGYPDGTFKPANYITRAEIAVALAKMTNRTNSLDVMAQKNTFSDLAGYDWAKGYINAAADAGFVKGSTATTFAPGRNISYAELITMLIRTKGGAASELEAYGNWPDNYIQFALTYNILGDVTVADWNAPATRGDTAKLMYRVMPK